MLQQQEEDHQFKKTNFVQTKHSAFHTFDKFELSPLDTTGTTDECSMSHTGHNRSNSTSGIPFCPGIPRQCSGSFVHIPDDTSLVTVSVSTTVPEYVFVENDDEVEICCHSSEEYYY
eukprot:scaffold1830_cov117-Cylindrotheca_fusiformis.AAC.24